MITFWYLLVYVQVKQVRFVLRYYKSFHQCSFEPSLSAQFDWLIVAMPLVCLSFVPIGIFPSLDASLELPAVPTFLPALRIDDQSLP